MMNKLLGLVMVFMASAMPLAPVLAEETGDKVKSTFDRVDSILSPKPKNEELANGNRDAGIKLYKKKQYSDAMHSFKLAVDADPSDRTSLFYLGYLYENGLGTKKDSVQASKYYRLSSAAGNELAEERLQKMYGRIADLRGDGEDDRSSDTDDSRMAKIRQKYQELKKDPLPLTGNGMAKNAGKTLQGREKQLDDQIAKAAGERSGDDSEARGEGEVDGDRTIDSEDMRLGKARQKYQELKKDPLPLTGNGMAKKAGKALQGREKQLDDQIAKATGERSGDDGEARGDDEVEGDRSSDSEEMRLGKARQKYQELKKDPLPLTGNGMAKKAGKALQGREKQLDDQIAKATGERSGDDGEARGDDEVEGDRSSDSEEMRLGKAKQKYQELKKDPLPLTGNGMAKKAGKALQGREKQLDDQIAKATGERSGDDGAEDRGEDEEADNDHRSVKDQKGASAKAKVPSRNVALVIGVDEYKNFKKLKTAVNDANGISDVLEKSYNFQIIKLINAEATRDNIFRTLNSLRKNLNEGDKLLIYYAGHGEYNNDTDSSYWLPVDAEKDDTTKWLESRAVADQLKLMALSQVLIVSDSCFSGTLSRKADSSLTDGRLRRNYLERLMSKPSRVLIASGGNEPVTDGGGNGHSVFADVLIKALNNPFDQIFTAEELMTRHIKEPVAGRSDQTPEYKVIRNSGHDGGDFVFVKRH